MINFDPVREDFGAVAQLGAGLDAADLRALTNEMIDRMLALVEGCEDADVTFLPQDPQAYDEWAATEEEVALSWTLGHVIVHVTASAEEAAFLAAELARGVPWRGGRSRSEVPWETITTMDQVRHRLEESRRMRLASLDMWPDTPYLENARRRTREVSLNAVSQFLLGLKHDDDHLLQIENIVRQARQQLAV
jgi:hypothetical protein